jgi:hypothetical protein
LDKNFDTEEDGFDFKEILMADTVSPEDENLKEIFWEALARLDR